MMEAMAYPICGKNLMMGVYRKVDMMHGNEARMGYKIGYRFENGTARVIVD